MKTFVIKISVFITIIFSLCVGSIYLSHLPGWNLFFANITGGEKYIVGNANGSDEIKPFIYAVQEKDNTNILIIGDSVCNQMFSDLNELNEQITIAASNGAITMAGQYILAKLYLDNHENATDIYLMVHPDSLCRTFDTQHGYQYVVMPFSGTGNLELLNESTIDTLKDTYGKLFIRQDVVYLIDKSALNRKLYFNVLKKYGTGYKQVKPYELADEYIAKIYKLCEMKNVELHLLASPVSEMWRDKCKDLEDNYKGTWLEEKYPDFYKDIMYFSNIEADDGTHFSGEYETQECFNEKIRIVFKNTSLLETLKME